MQAKELIIIYKNQIHCISLPSLILIHKKGRKTFLLINNGEEIECSQSVNSLYKEINKGNFIFIDKGKVINLDYINKYLQGHIQIKTLGIMLKVSRRNKTKVKNMLQTRQIIIDMAEEGDTNGLIKR